MSIFLFHKPTTKKKCNSYIRDTKLSKLKQLKYLKIEEKTIETFHERVHTSTGNRIKKSYCTQIITLVMVFSNSCPYSVIYVIFVFTKSIFYCMPMFMRILLAFFQTTRNQFPSIFPPDRVSSCSVCLPSEICIGVSVF